MLFGKSRKKQENNNKIEQKPLSIGQMYLECAGHYISYQGKLRGIENPLQDNDFYQEWAGPFYNSAMHFVNYLENTYTDEMLSNEEVIDLDLNKMLENATDTTVELFSEPKYPGLVYLNDSLYSTHFHIDGDTIYEAEGIQVLPGLSNVLANEKINKLFVGLTPTEAKELLKQMGIYPKDTELDLVIEDYKERKNIQLNFLKSVICLLLIRRSNYGITRARLFADSLNIPFNFAPFEMKQEQIKNKTL